MFAVTAALSFYTHPAISDETDDSLTVDPSGVNTIIQFVQMKERWDN
jgi:hypothetical protein